MSEEENAGLVGEIEHGPSKFDQFLEKYFKLLIIGAVLLALIVAAFVVMKELAKGKEEAAGARLSGANDAAAYQKIIDENNGTRAAATAQILLANQQWQDGQQEKSIASLKGFIADNPDHPALATAQMSLGQRYLSQDKKDLAKEQFLAVTNNPNGNYLGAYASIELGNLEKAAGNKEDALQYYEQASSNYPNNSPVSSPPSAKFFGRQLTETIDAAPPEVATEPEVSELPTPPTPPVESSPATQLTDLMIPESTAQATPPAPIDPSQLIPEAPAPEAEVQAPETPEVAMPSFVPATSEGEEAAPALSDKVKKFASKLTSVDAEDEAALNKVYQDLANDGGANFLYRIPFATGETGVPSAHQEALITKLKTANPEATLVTIGYADTRGDDAQNKKLSYGRAREVASWINSTLGTKANLETFSMGETDRFSKNDFSKNRVVEVWQITE